MIKESHEFYREFYHLDNQGELTNSDIDFIRCMEEYADQFRKPEKKTIEESMTGCRDEFKPALRTWLEYKAEKNQRYKAKGLESLVKKFNKF